MENKLFLLIDGDYFCHRTIHGIRISEKDFDLTTQNQKERYISALKNSLTYLLERFSSQIYNVAIVFDNNSWRKSIPGFRPYYLKDDTTISVEYKDNRKELKEKSDIDYMAFYDCKDMFSDFLKNKISVFNNVGLEGDDWLMLVSRKIAELSPNNYSCILCTDGDIEQLVTNQTFIYKNSKSKECPNGKMIISSGIYESMFGSQSQIQRLTDTSNKFKIYDDIFGLNIDFKNLLQRKPGIDIIKAQPFTVILNKIFCGDAKDNIFPIFRWKAKTGTRNYSVTEKIIQRVFKDYNYDYSETGISKLFQNNESITNLIIGLANETNQFDVVKPIFKEIGNHFKHNAKVLTLSQNQLPEHIINIFNNSWEENINSNVSLSNRKFNFEEIAGKMSTNLSQNNGTDINKISIPTIL